MASAKIPAKIIDGPNAAWDTSDTFCQITIAAAGTLQQGMPVLLLVSSLGPNATTPVCEQVVKANGTGAGPVFGVYQGPNITNGSSAAVTYTIQVRTSGYGVVYAGAVAAGTAVTVGGSLVVTSANPFATEGSATIFATVGVALATGAVTAPGASLIAVPGSGTTNLLVNALIQVA